jgi:predicted nucleic acid-binding protein
VKYFFLDTSVFVKAYVAEPGEKRVRGLIHGAVANPPSCRVIVTDFTFLEASDVAADVPSVIRRYGLRPGDAVHIAAALASRSSTPAESSSSSSRAT